MAEKKENKSLFRKSIIVNIFLAFVFIAIIVGLGYVGLVLKGPKNRL